MDRDRQRGDNQYSHPAASSWPSGDPAPYHDGNFDSQRGGFPSDSHLHHHRHQHHSDNRNHYNFNTEQNNSVGGSGVDIGSSHSLPPWRKRQFSHSGHGAPPDCSGGGSFVKLYIRGIPRTATEEEVRPLFEEYGDIVEVVLLKDKRTGQRGECCFVKYTSLEEGDRAIGALHNKYTFPGGMVPLTVRYADGERERLGGFGRHEYKLYVGSLNKQASKREIEEIFSAYGFVEEVYIVRDDMKQSRGCGFVQFSQREMAVAAMNALSGTYVMRGCDQPLVVRFADPKKPRIGESRDSCKFGSSSVGFHFQEPVVRPPPHLNDQIPGHVRPVVSHPCSPKAMVSSSQSPPICLRPQTVASTSTFETVLSSSISTAPAVPISTQITESLDSDWSEHTCPDGYKYYYNCVTCESRWEKPEEHLFFEKHLEKQQAQQNVSCQDVHSLSNSLVISTQEVSHMQQARTSPSVAPTCVWGCPVIILYVV